MNDLEQRLKDVLETDAAKAPRVPRAPEGLKRQVRRRQIGTTLVGMVAVVAILGVSLAGLRAIDRSQGTTPVDDPWASYQVFERTAQIENFTITSASDLYLVHPLRTLDALSTSTASTTRPCSCRTSTLPQGRPAGHPSAPGGAVLALRMDLQRIETSKIPSSRPPSILRPR